MPVSRVYCTKPEMKRLTYDKLDRRLDLGSIRFLLVKKDDGPRWSRERVRRVEELYKRFLYLAYTHPEVAVVPSKEVDEFWHAHIMDTEKYVADCEAVFGEVLHHYPYLGVKGPEDVQALKRAFENTNSLMQAQFGIDMRGSQASASLCGGKCGGKCRSAGWDTGARPRLD